MLENKSIEYKNGMKFTCGPPIRSGGYKEWNWCKTCTSIWEKHIIRCGECKQLTRGSSKNNLNNASNRRTRKEREEYRADIIRDLREWESKRDRR